MSSQTDFETFHDIIRKKESDPENPFIRTGVRPEPGERGSTAYGPLQTTRGRVGTMLTQLSDVLTKEEVSALTLLRSKQKLASKYGGSDRYKYEDPKGPDFKSKEFLDMYDYGGSLGITDTGVQSAIASAQKKELLRHFEKHGEDVGKAAAAWHGGDSWETSKNSPNAAKAVTMEYAVDAVERKKKKKMSGGGIVDTYGRRLI